MRTALVVAPHPDDAEIGMGGTIVKMINNSWYVVVVDLTDGEPTPFGSKEIRAEETQKASSILGIKERVCLDMPNRNLQPTLQYRRKLAEIIRIYKPDVLFAPVIPDWHPDHRAAWELTEAARFEAKYHKTNLAGQPHWTPKLLLYYSPHRHEFPMPSIIVDISNVWREKISAIKAYQSQLKNNNSSHGYNLLEKVEIIAKYFGQCIDMKYGEPLLSCSPVPMKDIGFFISS